MERLSHVFVICEHSCLHTERIGGRVLTRYVQRADKGQTTNEKKSG